MNRDLQAATILPAARRSRLRLPESYNYIGVFLTFRCPYRCSFCINRHDPEHALDYRERSGGEWIDFFERLEQRDVPVTLQGGEPGLHPDFIEIVARLSRTRPVDILSNLAFDLEEFIRRVPPERLNRPAPYAPIRVSYHPEQFALEEIVARLERLQDAGFRVGLYGVTHPLQMEAIRAAEAFCRDRGLDFRVKPFLGRHAGRLYGEYVHPEACNGRWRYACECASTELLLAPDGGIHRCHYYLYNRLPPLVMIDEAADMSDEFLPCAAFGLCNPCDVKVKNNRFQQFGHVAARIRNISKEPF